MTVNPLPERLKLQWHHVKNGDLGPDDVSRGSHKKVWWLGACGHAWQAVIKSRVRTTGTRTSGCPECKWVRVGTNDLATTNPELLSQWHPTKNGNLTPDNIAFSSMVKVWWICEAGHEWQTTVNHRTSKKRGCAVCAGQKVQEGYNDILTTHPDIRSLWHPTKNSSLRPEDVSFGSHTKVWWLGKCGHEWQAQVKDVLGKNSDCPVCASKTVLPEFNDLEFKHPILSQEWHPHKNIPLDPTKIVAGSHRKVWWLGKCGHEWQAQVYARVAGNGCPQCALRASGKEQELLDFVEALGLRVERNNRSRLRGKELDGYLPDHQVALEFNGVFWHDEDHKGKAYHYDKWLACKEEGIKLIQVWEDEWTRNPAKIKRMLVRLLGVSGQEEMLIDETDVVQISRQEAEDFLSESCGPEDNSEPCYYLGLKNPHDSEIVAVLALQGDADSQLLTVLKYLTEVEAVDGLAKLLAYATHCYQPDGYVAFSDHCVSDGRVYQANGFIADRELPPDYRYVVGGRREHKFKYDLNRFETDPALEYREGLTELELADLNNLKRIWDAGSTLWHLKVRSD